MGWEGGFGCKRGQGQGDIEVQGLGARCGDGRAEIPALLSLLLSGGWAGGEQEAGRVESEGRSLRGSRCHNYGNVKTLKTGGAPNPVDKACHPVATQPMSHQQRCLQGHPQQSVLSGMVRLSPTETVVNEKKAGDMLWHVPVTSALKRLKQETVSSRPA